MKQPAIILIVDDVAANRDTLRELLGEDDFQLIEAADGPTALRLAAETPPDLVLLDVTMPGMDGYEVCRRLRADARFAEMPIIMVTALDDQASRLAGIEAGADDFITKPYNRVELRARVRTISRLNRYRRLLETREGLRESEERFIKMAESSNDVFWFVANNPERITFLSPAVEKIWGRPAAQYYEDARLWMEAVHPDDRIRVRAAYEDLISGRAAQYKEEYRVVQPEGTVHWVLATGTPIHNACGVIVGAGGVARDITERKQAEEYKAMGTEVLRILNEPGNLQDSVQRVVAELKIRAGFDAVGIRLQDGDDFPYLAQQGFSKDFLLTENTLVASAAEGGLCRNKDGSACLECTCGLVISGRTDPANPLFTPSGSCWTNDSLVLLDLPANEDPRFHPRNQCIHHGYASVALVPIRNKERIVGLIQLNSRRKGCFTFATVELLEGIAENLGAALLRKQAEAALLQEQILFTDLTNTIPDHIYFKDRRSRFIRINGAMARRFGLRDAAEAVGKTDFEIFSEDHARQAYGDEQRIMESGDPMVDFEEKETWPDGHVTWVSTTKAPLRDPQGCVPGWSASLATSPCARRRRSSCSVRRGLRISGCSRPALRTTSTTPLRPS